MTKKQEDLQRIQENPRLLDMHDQFTDKYAEKEDYEDADTTFWTRLMYVALHLVIAAGTVWGVYSLPLVRMEQVVMTTLASGIALALEWFKGSYMERYFIAKLKTENLKISREIRVANQKRERLNFKILMVFWFISIGVFSTAGIFVAQKQFGTAPDKVYDTTLQTAFTAATAALTQASKQGAGSGTLRNLTQKVETARISWENHKSDVEAEYALFKSDHEDEVFKYGLLAFIFCFALELALFAARRFHETNQYKMSHSVNELFANTGIDTGNSDNSHNKSANSDKKGANSDNSNANSANSERLAALEKEKNLLADNFNVLMIQNRDLKTTIVALEKLLVK